MRHRVRMSRDSHAAHRGIMGVGSTMRVGCVRAGLGPARRIPDERRLTMTNHQLEGKGKQFKGKVKEQWGKLTDDEIDQVQGKREQLVGKVQERYGKGRAEAEKEVNDFFDRLAG